MGSTGQGIDEFSDQVIYDFLIESPQLAANLGIDQVGSRTLPKDGMPDSSAAGVARRRAIVSRHARTLQAFDSSELRGEQAITARVLDYVLNEGFYESISGIAGHGFIDNPYPLNHLDAPHSTLVSLLVQYHVLADAADADAYLSRLEHAHLLFDGVTEALQTRARQGVFAPAESMRTAISELQQFCAPEPEANLLVSTCKTRLQSALDETRAGKYAAAAADVLARKVLPSIEALVQQAQDHLLHGQETVGAWQLPDGNAWYAWRLRGHTTTIKTPDEIHRLGLAGIDVLHADIRRGFADLGI